MPFTLAHPAAVLPFPRVFILSALVIGSMAPDVSHFVPLPNGHTLSGLIIVCVPVGLVSYVLFHLMLKRPLVYLLPIKLSSHIPESSLAVCPVSLRHLLLVSFSILLGAATHVIWDAFTHRGAFFVERVPSLQAGITALGGYEVTGYKILQHGSTILGLLIIAWAVRHWYLQSAPVQPKQSFHQTLFSRRAARILVLGIPLVVAAWQHVASGPWLQVLRQFVGHGIIVFGQSFAICLLIYAAVWWMGVRRDVISE